MLDSWYHIMYVFDLNTYSIADTWLGNQPKQFKWRLVKSNKNEYNKDWFCQIKNINANINSNYKCCACVRATEVSSVGTTFTFHTILVWRLYGEVQINLTLFTYRQTDAFGCIYSRRILETVWQTWKAMLPTLSHNQTFLIYRMFSYFANAVLLYVENG